MGKIYFTADLHLGHHRLAEKRGFNSVDAMNRTLIGNINGTVWPDEELWILGDFSYKITKQEAQELLQKIKCRNVHLIRGNHDKDWQVSDGWESVDDYVELKTESGELALFHYPIEEWNKRRKGNYHFHGHIHGTEEENMQNAAFGIHRYDVGVDANNFLPVELDEVLTKMLYIESMVKDGFTLDEIESNKGELVSLIRPL